MFRVIYEWRVAPENFAAFQDAWRAATNFIHETVPGANGSFMLRSAEDETRILTIAKWTTEAAWRRFWGDADPNQMAEMRRLGERVSAETFEEVENHER